MKSARLFFASGSLVFGLVFLSTCTAQFDQDLQQARNYPPTMFEDSFSENNIISLQWQIQQLQAMRDSYANRLNEAEDDIAQAEQQVTDLEQRVPTNIRGLGDEVRSELVGKAVEQLLHAKLDLATLESSVVAAEISQGSKENKKLELLRQQELEIETAMARRRAELADAETARTDRLRNNGSLSEQQAERARASAEMAQLELEAAKIRAAVEKERIKVESSRELTARRIEMKPLKARMEAVESFLADLSRSNELSTQIKRLKRKVDRNQRQIERINAELFQMDRKMLELTTLKRLIESEITKPANNSEK